MKKLLLFLVIMLVSTSIFAQSPEKMSYQAVVRNSDGELLVNSNIEMQISVLQGSASGTAVYVERHFPTTNANGLVTLEIGSGTVISGSFSTIDWANGLYFIKTETDLNGGANYTISGTSQLLSVPYAMHAKTAETLTGEVEYTETDPTVPAHVKDIETEDITNWNEAHSWGDHSAEGYATQTYVDENTPATYEIGDLAHGGIVFYVEPCGTKGLVAATEDQSDGIKWRGGSTYYATMARGRELYAGKMNTSIIIAVHSAKDDFDEHAALICANYTGGGFGDWYLPSRDELKLMYDNLHDQTPALGGFSNEIYWSSSEYDADSAWYFNFGRGFAYDHLKYNSRRVRAVRAF